MTAHPRAGTLNRLVTVRRSITTPADLADEKTWTVAGQVWAEKTDVSDGERIRAAEVAATVTTRFRMRWDSFTAGITAADRLVLDGLIYDITGAKEIGTREGIEITAAARPDLQS